MRYTVNWSTPGALSSPATVPSVQGGALTATVASGTTHTVKNVTELTVVLPFSGLSVRYGAVYFTGWLTATGETVQPDTRVGYSELAQYDSDGDGDDNTFLWEFGDVKYNEQWAVTEYPPRVEGSADYAEWIVVDSTAALNQTETGTGGTVTVSGTTHATDLEDPERLRAEFNNIYFRGNTLLIKKEDAATGKALAGAEFQLYQGDELMTFDYDAETGLYDFNSHGTGAIQTLVCDGYANINTSGFAYDRGDITAREVKTPAGYHSIDEPVIIGYTEDTDGDGTADAVIGIKSASGDWARYDQGLLVIRNSSAPVTVSVLKKWSCADSERTDVTVQLLANGSANDAVTLLRESGQAATATLTAVDGWYHEWKNRPTVANGETVAWSVRELKIGTENCKAKLQGKTARRTIPSPTGSRAMRPRPGSTAFSSPWRTRRSARCSISISGMSPARLPSPARSSRSSPWTKPERPSQAALRRPPSRTRRACSASITCAITSATASPKRAPRTATAASTSRRT